MRKAVRMLPANGREVVQNRRRGPPSFRLDEVGLCRLTAFRFLDQAVRGRAPMRRHDMLPAHPSERLERHQHQRKSGHCGFPLQGRDANGVGRLIASRERRSTATVENVIDP